eukprot:gene5071-34866_t
MTETNAGDRTSSLPFPISRSSARHKKTFWISAAGTSHDDSAGCSSWAEQHQQQEHQQHAQGGPSSINRRLYPFQGIQTLILVQCKLFKSCDLGRHQVYRQLKALELYNTPLCHDLDGAMDFVLLLAKMGRLTKLKICRPQGDVSGSAVLHLLMAMSLATLDVPLQNPSGRERLKAASRAASIAADVEVPLCLQDLVLGCNLNQLSLSGFKFDSNTSGWLSAYGGCGRKTLKVLKIVACPGTFPVMLQGRCSYLTPPPSAPYTRGLASAIMALKGLQELHVAGLRFKPGRHLRPKSRSVSWLLTLDKVRLARQHLFSFTTSCMSHLDRAAEVPAHKDPNRALDDFVALNKSLRSCFVCRLVKSEKQFFEGGCDNCNFLQMEEDRGRVSDFTTPNFSG